MPWVNYNSPFGTLSAWVEDSVPLPSDPPPAGFSVTEGSYIPRSDYENYSPPPSFPPDFPQTPAAASDPRDGLQPWQSSGNDLLDKERGKGIYYVAPTTTGSNGESSAPPNPNPVSPAPVLPGFISMPQNNRNFKVAPIDTIVFDESNVDVAMIQNLLFEDIGAVELANMSRTDLIDGQNVIYSPIANLPIIRRQFNPMDLIATAYSSNYFSRFGINIFSKGAHEPYFDEYGNLVVEVDSIGDNEEFQVEVLSSGTIDEVDEI